MSLANLPISWVKNLDTLATKSLKVGLAGQVNQHLSLLSAKEQRRSPASIHLHLFQEAKAASLMSSRDPLVCHLDTQQTLAEASAQRQVFKPFQQVAEVIQEYHGLVRRPWQHEQKAQWQRWIHWSILSSAGPSRCRDRLPDSLRTDLHICGPKLFTSPDHVTHFALNPGTDTLLHTLTCTCGGRSHHPSASCVLTSRPFSMCSITAVWLWRDGATTRTTMTFFGHCSSSSQATSNLAAR